MRPLTPPHPAPVSWRQAEGRAARKALQEEVEAATQKMQRIDPLLAAVAAVPWLESTRVSACRWMVVPGGGWAGASAAAVARGWSGACVA